MPDEHDRTPEAYPDPATTTPEKVLLIQAHPDDAEFSCSGTIAKWARAGAEIHYCSITSGDKGSSDPNMSGPELATIREKEQRRAAEILGVKSVTFLGYQDAMLVPDLNLRRDLTRVMRRIRPTALVCQDPTMRYIGREYINHPDHIAAGEASLAAVFPSVRDRMTFPELLDEGLEPLNIPNVYIFGTTVPDCWIDISDTIEVKLEALKAHSSQVGTEGAEKIVKDWGRRNAMAHPDRPEGFGEFAETFKYMHIG